MLDDLALAILQTELALLPATGIIVHPVDYRRMMLVKDLNENYIAGGPFGGPAGTIWQLPAVVTPAIERGTFSVGAFGLGCQIWDREVAEVFISTEDSDNFRKNRVTLLAEQRLAMAVRRPAAIVAGSYSNTTE